MSQVLAGLSGKSKQEPVGRPVKEDVRGRGQSFKGYLQKGKICFGRNDKCWRRKQKGRQRGLQVKYFDQCHASEARVEKVALRELGGNGNRAGSWVWFKERSHESG